MISIYAHKGGVGVTTVAAALAVCLGETKFSGDPATILADTREFESVCRALGCGPGRPDHDGRFLPVEARGVTVHDMASATLDVEPDIMIGYRGGDVTRLVVTRCCYLAAHLESMGPSEEPATGLIVIVEPGRALSAEDMARFTGIPLAAAIPWDPAIARAIDAGLMCSKMPNSLARPLRSLLQKVTP